jgi:hypothetical protein
MLELLSRMSSPEHVDLLVRAFKAAWEHYFEPAKNGGVLECMARPALAEFLVGKAREGIDDEPSLAAAGLAFLFSLEDTPDDERSVDASLQDVSPEEPVDKPISPMCGGTCIWKMQARDFFPLGTSAGLSDPGLRAASNSNRLIVLAARCCRDVCTLVRYFGRAAAVEWRLAGKHVLE